MLLQPSPAYLIEPEHVRRGGAVCIDGNTIVDKICNLERRANCGSGCAGLEAMAR
jgi:hypothetical protein